MSRGHQFDEQGALGIGDVGQMASVQGAAQEIEPLRLLEREQAVRIGAHATSSGAGTDASGPDRAGLGALSHSS